MKVELDREDVQRAVVEYVERRFGGKWSCESAYQLPMSLDVMMVPEADALPSTLPGLPTVEAAS